MASSRTSLVAVCILLVASGVCAQGGAKAMAKPESVLDHIPAGALGFAVVSSAEGVAGKVDKLLADLGVSQMLPSPDPDNPEKKMPVLDLVRGGAQLGQGFNPKGGAAVVMLNPKDFDIDLLQLMGAAPPAEGGEDEAPAAPPKIPFVILVPGTGVKEVFGAYPMEQAGKYTLINLRMGPTYATKVGGYVALSPHDKALDAVAGTKKKAVSELPPEQVKLLGKMDLAYCINMKVAGPMLAQLMQQLEQQMTMQAGPMAPLMKTYFGFYRDVLQQMDAVTVGIRVGKTGIILEELASFKPDSTYTQAIAAAKPTGKVGLNALPDLPYGLAVGSTGETDEHTIKLTMDMVNELLKGELFQGVADEEKARMRKLVRGMLGQVAGVQMVIGGTPSGSGLFGASFVIRCKDAAEVKALLGEEAKLIQNLIRHFAADEPDAQKLAIRYVKSVETIAGVSVDAVSVEHPELDKMEEEDRAEMKKALGEDKVRFLVAAPDKKTVVVTFGGSRKFMAEALKAARGTGTIGTTPGDLAALKHMPAKPETIILINGANIYKLIVDGVKTMEPDEELPPFKIACKTPVAMGIGYAGRNVHVVVYVPTELVKEVVGVFTAISGMRPGAAPPPEGPDDF